MVLRGIHYTYLCHSLCTARQFQKAPGLANQALYSYSTDMLCSYLQTKDIGWEEMCVLTTCHEQYHDWRALYFIRKQNSSKKLNFLFNCSSISLHILDLNTEKDKHPVYRAHSQGLFAINR